MGEMRKAYNIFAVKLEDKRLVGRSRRRWGNNFKMDLGETGMEDVGWIHLA
jgi:hypothetical protein